jgi:RNA polymerase sigma factor (sigma-70 family)
MATRLIYYLVDHDGRPLSARYETAVAQLDEGFVRRFPRLSDPADISNAVEETARRVASYEAKYGQVNNLCAFMVRAYSNLVNSIIRAGYYARCEASMSARELEVLACDAPQREKHKVEDAVLVRQTLDMLDERKRQLVILTAEGFSAREISARLGISERNVNTSLHRARAKVRQHD